MIVYCVTTNLTLSSFTTHSSQKRAKMKPRVIVSALPFLLIVSSVVVAAAADLDSDRQALLEFISYVPHVRKLNWDPSLPICGSWIGITCDPSNKRVVTIRLPAIGLYGSIPTNTLAKLDALKVLSLRSNYLNGTLPSDVTSIPSLQFLYLQHNNFTGTIIPISFSSRLKVLDLSFNSFTGTIPPTLHNLTRLTRLNLSFNNLDGSIPDSLRNFPDSSFLGNSHLSRNEESNVKEPPQNHKIFSSGKKIGTGTIVGLVVGGTTVLFFIVFFIVFWCLKNKKDGNGVLKKAINGGKEITSKDFASGVQEPEKNKLFFFQGVNNNNFDLEDLLRASAEVLGKGSYGTAYKAILDNGTTLVVKRLREVIAGKREFEQQMEVVAKAANHPNVVPILAYYYSKDEKLLVFQYMPEGSLFSRLHGARGSTPSLDWESRVKVGHGVAKAIAYIHSDSGGRTHHGDIKSNNVLLTADNDGLISDIGLTPLMNFTAAISRTIGYHPPEVIETRRVTQKSDVYSFGVLLLEMLTGKAPLQYPGYENAVDLPRWVRSVVREEWTSEVFDMDLLRGNNTEEEMVQMLQIALLCVSKLPDNRPTMDQVVKLIEEIGQGDHTTKERPSNSEAESLIAQTPSPSPSPS